MSEASETIRHQASVQRMMRRLEGFAHGLGLDEAATREIVEKIAIDMPVRTDEERLIEARLRMVKASA